MRGKVTNNAVCWQLFRITPAYAGKSGGNVMSQMAYTDHPRLCGEKLESDAILGENAGSPPPMRGKVLCFSVDLIDAGITPAYAGKSHSQSGRHSDCRDHPRLCGEKSDAVVNAKAIWGSPPPMRGKEGTFPTAFSDTRITPAYAGKRPKPYRESRPLWDHPRLCGEKP